MSSQINAAPSSARAARRPVPFTARTQRRLRGLVAATVVVAATAGASLVPEQAQAARSWSATIATQSQEALDSLHTWQSTHLEGDRVAYELLRDKLATTVAGAVGADAAALRTAWDEADLINQEIILTAGTQVGVPYKYLRSEKGVGFDCSGLTRFAYGAVGISLPRVSYDQIKVGDRVEPEAAEPGDLAQYPGHIMMYLGSGVIMHARSTGSYVEVASKPSRRMRYTDVTPDEGAAPANASAGEGAAAGGSPKAVPLVRGVGR